MTETIPPEAIETLDRLFDLTEPIVEIDEDYLEIGEIFDEGE